MEPFYDREVWQHFWNHLSPSWNSTESPLRLSQGDAKGYAKLLASIHVQGESLILGATTELEEILLSTCATVHAVDFSPRMLERILDKRVKTTLSDWMEMDFPDNFFDIICGDLFLQQLPPSAQPVLLERLAQLLKGGGFLLSRFSVASQQDDFSIENDIQDVLEGKDSEMQKFNKIRFILQSRFSSANQVFERNQAHAFLLEMQSSRKNLVLQYLLKMIDTPSFPSFRDWGLPTEQALKNTLSSYFDLQTRYVSDDYPEASFFPVLLLKRR